MRIGFACKILRQDGEKSKKFAFRSINRSQFRACGGRHPQRRKIAEIAFHNIETLNALISRFEHLPSIQRMFRMSNDTIPLLDLPEAQHVYRDKGFRRDLENALASVGKRARDAGVRLSTHPDQFIIPNSQRPSVAAVGVFYIEAWAEIAMAMGYRGKGHDDFCINVHLGPHYDSTKDLLDSWETVRRAMGADAYRLMTVENNDTRWTAFDLMRVGLEKKVRVVLDVHHNWCVTGVHVHPVEFPGIKPIISTWEGRRPKLHFSVPKPEVAGLKYPNGGGLHRRDLLRPSEVKGAIRPHADTIWSTSQLAYLRGWLHDFDVMLELKHKNLAAERAINMLELEHDGAET